jgi:hypothetical protein
MSILEKSTDIPNQNNATVMVLYNHGGGIKFENECIVCGLLYTVLSQVSATYQLKYDIPLSRTTGHPNHLSHLRMGGLQSYMGLCDIANIRSSK